MDATKRLLQALLPLVMVGCPGGGGGKGGDDTGIDVESSSACAQVDVSLTECPPAGDVVVDDMIPVICGATVLSVDGEGNFGSNPSYGTNDSAVAYCCYPVSIEPIENSCTYGRPYVTDGQSRLAETTDGGGWSGELCPDLDGLAPEARELLAAAWTAAALDEHAAVAAFGRVALDLMAHGAPADLVAWTLRAAGEEVDHARLGFALASGYAGRPVRPGVFPLGASVPIAADLAAFAAATAREGCVGETLTTLVALECLAKTSDPAARAALQQITRDELEHARLAWATVRWAIDAGGAPVRAAVAEVFARAAADGVQLPERLADGPHHDALVAHGVPNAAMARSSLVRGLREVVLPAAKALLASPVDPACSAVALAV
jgi:hypothetical protein